MKVKTASTVKRVALAAVIVALGYFVRHKVVETHAPVWTAAGWLLTAWAVLCFAAALKRGYARVKIHTRDGVNIDSIDKLTTELAPIWSRGFYAIEKRAYKGFWHTLTRKPLTAAGPFTVAGGPIGARLAPLLLAMVGTCGALAFGYLPDLVVGFWPRIFAFAGAGYAVLYAAVWIVGDRRALKEGGHRITGDALIVDLGIRCAGTVATDRIACCSSAGGRLRGVDTWTVSPGEAPNVVIELAAPTSLQITAFGSPREIRVSFIALYVDQPDEFAAAVSRASRRLAEAA